MGYSLYQDAPNDKNAFLDRAYSLQHSNMGYIDLHHDQKLINNKP